MAIEISNHSNRRWLRTIRYHLVSDSHSSVPWQKYQNFMMGEWRKFLFQEKTSVCEAQWTQGQRDVKKNERNIKRAFSCNRRMRRVQTLKYIDVDKPIKYIRLHLKLQFWKGRHVIIFKLRKFGQPYFSLVIHDSSHTLQYVLECTTIYRNLLMYNTFSAVVGRWPHLHIIRNDAKVVRCSHITT